MPKSSVVIITRNSSGYLRSCLQSLDGQSDGQVRVVDNASEDSIRIPVQSGIRLTINHTNLGFAGAANQGHSLHPDPITVLLNPDTVVAPGALHNLTAAFDDPTVGAAGGMLLDTQGDPQQGFQFRRFPTLFAMLCEVLLVNRLWPGNPWNRRYRCLDCDPSRSQFVEQPAGACLAVRRVAWESIGGFDESFYPVWFEDVDFCRRLIDRGWKIVYCPEARFSHGGGHSVSKLPFRDRQAFWYRNMLRYFSKHHGPLKTTFLRGGILAGLAVRAALSLIGFGPREVTIPEAMRGYMQAARTVLRRADRVQSPNSHSVGIAPV